MLRKYVVFNETFGNACYNGRRFFTLNGALRAYNKMPGMFKEFSQYSVRKIV